MITGKRNRKESVFQKRKHKRHEKVLELYRKYEATYTSKMDIYEEIAKKMHLHWVTVYKIIRDAEL